MYKKQQLNKNECNYLQFSSVQSLSCVRLFATPWIAARQASLSITNSRSSPKPTSIELWCHSTISFSVVPFSSDFSRSSIRVFSNQSVLCISWPKYWSFSFNISPSTEHPGLIFFRMDWLDLLAVQGTPKILLQHHSSKASILQCSAFFTVQLSHPYMTTGKTVALTRWIYSYISGNHLSLSSTPEPFFLKPIFDSFRFFELSGPLKAPLVV